MKKLFFVCFAFVTLLSCSNGEEPMQTPNQISSPDLGIRTIDEAKSLAEEALKLYGKPARTDKEIFLSDIVVINSDRSRSSISDTAIYAVNLKDGNGFVLVAAPRSCSKPVIGIAENGEYNDEAMNNTSFSYYLDKARSYAITPTPPDSGFNFEKFYDEVVYLTPIKPTVYENVSWGQRWPENIYCPNKVAGCVPVSIAQTLAFFETPSFIQLTNPDADQNSVNLDWTQLKAHKVSLDIYEPTTAQINTHLSSCGSNMETHSNIGRLLRELGHLCPVTYYFSPNKTGASHYGHSVARNLMGDSQFKYTYGTDVSELFEMYVKKSSSERSMAMVGGFAGREGHAWIADGHMCSGKKIEWYDRTTGELINVIDERDKYLHMNWGWAGQYNGFFLIDVLNPSKEYDSWRQPVVNSGPDMDFSSSFGFMFIEYK